MAVPIERKIMFGWRPGMGIASAKAKGTVRHGNRYGVREGPKLDPSRKDMEAMFDTLDEARAYLFRKEARSRMGPRDWWVYRFSKDKDYGEQVGFVQRTNRNEYGVVEERSTFILYTQAVGRVHSKNHCWFLNRDGSLGKRIY